MDKTIELNLTEDQIINVINIIDQANFPGSQAKYIAILRDSFIGPLEQYKMEEQRSLKPVD